MYARILVPVDSSPTAQRGLDEAIALASRLGSALTLLHVVDPRLLMSELTAFAPPAPAVEQEQRAGEALLAECLQRARASGVAAEGRLRCDPGLRVCDLIVQEARQSGTALIVMGTHGRRGLRRLTLGSDAEMVLREAPVPVLLVRSTEPDA
ncbi:MAG: universal stress protein [Burkholderiales bacterium]|nr:universal stress protein [Burkholderiales bacterium]